MVAGAEAVITQQALAATAGAAAVTPEASVAEGTDACLDAARVRSNAAENLASFGWQRTQTAPQTQSGASKSQSITKLGVRGTILPDGSCVFRADTVALSQLGQTVHDYVTEAYDGSVTVGSPHGRTGPCDGYTIKAPGLNAWLYFTSATGDVCTKGQAGSGLTVKVL